MKRLILIVGIFVLGLIGGFIFQENNEHLVSAGAKEKNQNNTVIELVYSTDDTINIKKNEEELQSQEKRDINKNVSMQKNEDVDKQTIGTSNNNYDTSSKKVFLTFDDGPTTLTPEILRILDENKVNATFFVIGRLAEDNPDIVRQSYLKGNMVLPHSYTHDYAIYSTFETFYEDFYRAEEAINNILDIELPPIFRFPGGSSNQTSFKYGGKQYMPRLTEDIKKRGYYYIDWNVSSGDTGSDYNDKDKMIVNVLEGAKNKDFAIVLFHDVSRNIKMAEILPEIINTFKGRGYEFRTFRDITEEELNKMISLKLANKPIIR